MLMKFGRATKHLSRNCIIAGLSLFGLIGLSDLQPQLEFARISPLQLNLSGQNLVTARQVQETAGSPFGDFVAGFFATLPSFISSASAESSPVAPTDIAILARALKNDVDLIYQFVHDTIEFEPSFGMKKGAVGALIHGRGTAYDQADLMVKLLHEAGHTSAVLVEGAIALTPAEIAERWGVVLPSPDPFVALGSDFVSQLLTEGGFPFLPITTGSLAGRYQIAHIWVQVNITEGGSTSGWIFDPGLKKHEVTSGIALATEIGFDSAAAFATRAKATATEVTTATEESIKNVSTVSVEGDLVQYAGTLATHIRTALPGATLDDIVGGARIVRTASRVRQTNFSFPAAALALLSNGVPEEDKAALGFKYSGIDVAISGEVLAGKRLTLSFNGAGKPELRLDGALVQTGTVPAADAKITMIAELPNLADLTVDAGTISPTGTYLIAAEFGRVGSRSIEYHRKRLSQARQDGALDDSEELLGENLAVISATYHVQTNKMTEMFHRVSGIPVIFRMQGGIAGYNGSPYVDLPFNNFGPVTPDKPAAASMIGNYLSIFESGTIEQMQKVPASSTIELLFRANESGTPIYKVDSTQALLDIQSVLSSNGHDIASLQERTDGGFQLFLPQSGQIVIDGGDGSGDSWTGTGFVGLGPGSISFIISGDLNGGFSARNVPKPKFNRNSSFIPRAQPSLPALPPRLSTPRQAPTAQVRSAYAENINSNVIADPVSMLTGHYLYSHDDIDTGTGVFPFALGFQRHYSSGRDLQDGTLGFGWKHNFDIRVAPDSDGIQGFGADSPVDAAAMIVSLFVNFELLKDDPLALDRQVISALTAHWAMEQLIDNSVTVSLSDGAEQFIKLADGTYNPPPGSASRLTEVAGGYEYRTKDGTVLDFNADNQLTQWQNSNGVAVTFTHVNNKLSTVANTFGRNLALDYDGNDRLTKVTASDGRFVTYAYDTDGQLISYTDAASEVTTYDYEKNAQNPTGRIGLFTKLFYPSFPATAFIDNTYDGEGRVESQINARGKSYEYFISGYRNETLDPEGNSTSWYQDGQLQIFRRSDQIRKTGDPAQDFLETYMVFDGERRVVKDFILRGDSIVTADDVTNFLSKKEFSYDDQHNVIQITVHPETGSPEALLVSSSTYETNFGKAESITDAKGRTTLFAINAANGNLEQITFPAVPVDGGALQTPIVTFAYNGDGQIRAQNAADGTVTQYDYNLTTAQLTQVRLDPTGLDLTTSFQYDPAGNLTITTDPKGNVTTIDYDLLRRPFRTTAPAVAGGNPVTEVDYDADGRITQTRSATGDALGPWKTTDTTYNAAGLTATVDGPEGVIQRTSFVYDDLDRGLTITGPLGRRIDSFYLPRGQLQKNVRFQSLSPEQSHDATVFTYTDVGKIESVTDANGRTTTYVYDDFQRLVKTTYPDLSTEEILSYDEVGNILQIKTRAGDTVNFTYDDLNRLTQKAVVGGDFETNHYDIASRVTSKSSVWGELTQTYDALGRVKTATRDGLATSFDRTVTYDYDANSNVTKMTWPDSFAAEYEYDALNRPIRILTRPSGGAATELVRYEYDLLSRRTKIIRNNGVGADTDLAFEADDDLDTLSHRFQAGALTYDYGYNLVGQRISETVSDAQHIFSQSANLTTAYTVNNLNQYTAVSGVVPTYDNNGNLATFGSDTFTFDKQNRLATVQTASLTTDVTYGPNSMRQRDEVAGFAPTDYLRAGADVIAEYNGLNGALLRRYIHGPGIDDPVAIIDNTGQRFFYHADGTGTIVALSNDNGVAVERYATDAFGNVDTASGTAYYRFAGRPFDGETGLYYNRARYYHPGLGRFMSPDPIGYGDGLNMYAYAGNDPLNNTDPSGLVCLPCVGAAINAGLEVAVILGQRASGQDIGLLEAAGRVSAAGLAGAAGVGIGTRAAQAVRTISALASRPAARTVVSGAVAGGAGGGSSTFIQDTLMAPGGVGNGPTLERTALSAGLGAVGGAVVGRIGVATSSLQRAGQVSAGQASSAAATAGVFADTFPGYVGAVLGARPANAASLGRPSFGGSLTTSGSSNRAGFGSSNRSRLK